MRLFCTKSPFSPYYILVLRTLVTWIDFINKQSRDDLMAIINEEKLKEQETFNYMKRCFEYNEIKTTGTDLDSILPKVSIFGGGRAKKKEVVLQKLTKYYEKYEGLI